MSNIREVAELANVSLGTVSNVLNRPEVVTSATRERVLAAIEALGFVRNASAHQLRVRRSKHIGLIVPDVADSFFTDIVRGVEDVANEAGYLVILCNSDNSQDKEGRYLRVLEEQRAAGILITPVHNDFCYLQRLRQQEIAVVLLDQPTQAEDICSVTVNDIHGGELATQHLLECGHRCIALISGPLDIHECSQQYIGMQQAISAAGLDPDHVIVKIPTSSQNNYVGEQCAERLLQHPSQPTAAFCTNDLLALGLMRGLHRKGIKIPDDIALVGYDDVDFASTLTPALTSIRQPKYQLGRTSARLLLDAINSDKEQHEHKHIVYEPELIVRDSTRKEFP
jgi:LacI family transcriptional regulator